MKFADVPYRTWKGRKSNPSIHNPSKLSTYAKVMRHVDAAIKRGASVDMDHKIVNPTACYGKPYDTISVTIKD